MRLVDRGPISNRRQLSLQDCRTDTMYPGLPEESRADFPRGGQANAAYLFQKITCEERRRFNRPIVYGRTREPGGLGIRFCWGNERNPVNSPKPVPTRGMHTCNQATSRAGTVSRSKGASPGKTRVLRIGKDSSYSLDSLDSLVPLWQPPDSLAGSDDSGDLAPFGGPWTP